MRKRIETQILRLKSLGVPMEAIEIPISGGIYLHSEKSIPLKKYWKSIDDNVSEKLRDEFFIVSTSALCIAKLLTDIPPTTDWRLRFNVAYHFQTKSNAQAIQSIDLLCMSNCYSDAFTVIRSLHSRTNALLLFSLNPELFDYWLKHPKDERFLDGHIRRELENNKVYSYPHFFEHFSEIIHGQFPALAESGYLTEGLFPEIQPVRNMAYNAAKFLIGIIGWVGVSMLQLEFELEEKEFPDELKKHACLQHYIYDDLLQPARLEHFGTTIAHERHWERMGKEKVCIAKCFDSSEYRGLIRKLHREKQPKKLSKRYRVNR